MNPSEQVFSRLAELGIAFETIEHPPVFTTAAANHYVVGKTGARTKSLFLTNKKRNAFYLFIMADNKRLNQKFVQACTGEKKLSFASNKELQEKMQTTPGSVSLFGLLANKEKDILIYFDEALLTKSRMCFHPNKNTQTIFLKTEDVLRFVEAIGFTYQCVPFDKTMIGFADEATEMVVRKRV